jgi:hypothetical protein
MTPQAYYHFRRMMPLTSFISSVIRRCVTRRCKARLADRWLRCTEQLTGPRLPVA